MIIVSRNNYTYTNFYNLFHINIQVRNTPKPQLLDPQQLKELLLEGQQPREPRQRDLVPTPRKDRQAHPNQQASPMRKPWTFAKKSSSSMQLFTVNVLRCYCYFFN